MKTKIAPIRTILVWIIGFLAMLLIGWTTQLIGILGASQDRAHDCAGLWSKLIIWLSGIEVIVEGAQYLDCNNPQVLAANHQGSFDIWAMAARLPVQFRWMVKKELFRIPALGGAMRAAGDISVDRNNPEQAKKDIKLGLERLKQGRSVLIFPEGTRTLSGEVGEFKAGAFLLAFQSQLPIVPITIDGSFGIMPRKSIWLHPQPIYITVHPPIPAAADLTRREKKELPEKVRQIVASGMKQI